MNKLGYVRIMTATPELKVANCTYNSERICSLIDQAEAQGCDLLVLPELCTTGYTCGDLFLHKTLLDASDRGLLSIAAATTDKSVIVVAGAPIRGNSGVLYNCAAILCGGEVQAFVPKCNLPNYGEFAEMRYFTEFDPESKEQYLSFAGEEIPVGSYVFQVEGGALPYRFGVEICEDLWVPNPPGIALSQMGAQIIVNLSANNETIGKDEARRRRVAPERRQRAAVLPQPRRRNGRCGACDHRKRSEARAHGAWRCAGAAACHPLHGDHQPRMPAPLPQGRKAGSGHQRC